MKYIHIIVSIVFAFYIFTILPIDLFALFVALSILGVFPSILFSNARKEFLKFLEDKYPEGKKEFEKQKNIFKFIKGEWFQSNDNKTLKEKGDKLKKSFMILIVSANIGGLVIMFAIFYKAGILG